MSPTLKPSGVMTSSTATFYVEIVDKTSTPATFKWKKGTGGSFVTSDVSTDATALSDGVSIAFTGTTEFDSANTWEFTVTEGADASDVAVTSTNTEHTRFSIQGSGKTTVHNAGLSVEAGGGKIDSGGVAVVSDGAYVRAGGLFIHGGGATVGASGIYSDNGGLNTMTRAATADAAAVVSSHTTFAGTLLRMQSTRSASTAFKFGEATTNEYHRQNRGIAVAGTNTGDNTNITIRVEHAGMFPHRWRFKKDGDEEFSEEPLDASLAATEVVEGEGITVAWDSRTGYTDGATFVIPVFKDLATQSSWINMVNNVSTPTIQWDVDGTGSMTSAALGVAGNQVVGSQSSTEVDVPSTNDPADGTILGLSFSSTITQVEVSTLKSKCEQLRDFASDVRTTLNNILAKLRTHGLITS